MASLLDTEWPCVGAVTEFVKLWRTELFQITLAIQLQNEGKSVSEVMEGEDIEEEEELGLEKTDQPGKEAEGVRPGRQ